MGRTCFVHGRRWPCQSSLDSGDEVDGANVVAFAAVAVAVDPKIPEFVPPPACLAVAGIAGRTLGEQRNVPVARYLVVVHKHAEARIADEIGRGKIDGATLDVPNDVIAEGKDGSATVWCWCSERKLVGGDVASQDCVLQCNRSSGA